MTSDQRPSGPDFDLMRQWGQAFVEIGMLSQQSLDDGLTIAEAEHDARQLADLGLIASADIPAATTERFAEIEEQER